MIQYMFKIGTQYITCVNTRWWKASLLEILRLNFSPGSTFWGCKLFYSDTSFLSLSENLSLLGCAMWKTKTGLLPFLFYKGILSHGVFIGQRNLAALPMWLGWGSGFYHEWDHCQFEFSGTRFQSLIALLHQHFFPSESSCIPGTVGNTKKCTSGRDS